MAPSINRRLGTRVWRSAAAAGALTALAMLAGAGAVATASASEKTPKPLTSRTFAGYQVTVPKTHIQSATVTFVVPTITCHKNYSGVGPSILIDSTVVKNTYTYSGGGIAVVCENKQPNYVALPIVDGLNYNDTNVPIAAGNTVTVTVKYASKTIVTLTDDTTHQVDTHTGKRSVGLTASFGDSGIQVNHKGLGLDAFTTTQFSDAEINGRPFGGRTPLRYEWVDSHKVTLVTAGAITDKDDFTTSFKHST